MPQKLRPKNQKNQNFIQEPASITQTNNAAKKADHSLTTKTSQTSAEVVNVKCFQRRAASSEAVFFPRKKTPLFRDDDRWGDLILLSISANRALKNRKHDTFTRRVQFLLCWPINVMGGCYFFFLFLFLWVKT